MMWRKRLRHSLSIESQWALLGQPVVRQCVVYIHVYSESVTYEFMLGDISQFIIGLNLKANEARTLSFLNGVFDGYPLYLESV